ncbi:hypothetical protein [Flavobacterium sp. PS2]|uniref:hypothetical protein n=1 Tax=Flavobacterium sp. PS2 TaxID=3384157 RepID=UPI00390C4E07
MTFSEVFKDMVEASKERIKTPIAGAFTLAFVLYNWRPIALLLSSKKTIEENINFIDKNFIGLHTILNPFIIALIYSMVIPIVGLLLDMFLVFVKRKRLEIIYNNKGFVYDLKIKITSKALQLRKEELEVDRLNAQVELARKQIDDLDDKLINRTQKVLHRTQEFQEFNKILQNFSAREIRIILSTFKNLSKKQLEDFDLSILDDSVLSKFEFMSMITVNNGNQTLSELGIKFIDFAIEVGYDLNI